MKGINVDEVYAPSIRFTSLRIILHIAATLDLEIVQGDFVNAFLNHKLSEKRIYMIQPEGFEDPDHPDWVCKLYGNIYGLKQGARVWYECFDKMLRTHGIIRTEADQALWLKILIFLLAHVDDILIVGNKNETAGVKAHLSSAFKFKDLGNVHHFVGLVITRDRKNHRLYIDQAPYVRKILDKFKMENCIPVSIPIYPKETWAERPDDISLLSKAIKVYQCAIRKLMYLMLATRPDLVFSVTKLAQFASAPFVRHWQGVLRIMRYLRSHDSARFMLGHVTPPIQILNPPPRNLLGFFDASLMDCVKTRRSTGGYVFFLNSACIC